MKPSNRILLAGVIIEAMLAAVGVYLMMQISSGAMTTSVNPSEAKATILSVLGIAMGGLAGLVLVVYIMLRKRES